MWFPDGSPGFGRMKKQQRVFFFFWWWKSIPVQCATQQPDSSCLCRRDILEKVLEQFLHWYFFTSEWVCRWALRLDLSAKALLQWGQANGFSPVRGEMRKKTLLEILHRQIWIEMIFTEACYFGQVATQWVSSKQILLLVHCNMTFVTKTAILHQGRQPYRK